LAKPAIAPASSTTNISVELMALARYWGVNVLAHWAI
jgi:hypothetical protein